MTGSTINAVLAAIELGEPEQAQELILAMTPAERRELEPLLAAKQAHYREQQEFCAMQIEFAECAAHALENTGAKTVVEILDHPDRYPEAAEALYLKAKSLGLLDAALGPPREERT